MKSERNLEELITSLNTIRYFVNRKTYASIKSACMIHIPKRIIRKMESIKTLEDKPTIYDFFSALSTVENFLMIQTEITGTAELNSRGYHSYSIVQCMNVLFKHHDYECIEELALMIDEDDVDITARKIRKNLLTTRNNMVAKK